MFTYLEKYKKLPEDLRAKIATPEILAVIGRLEEQYKISLATLVMRIMIKEITFRHLPLVLDEEFSLNPEQAETLSRELETKVFKNVAEYLGIAPVVPPVPKPEAGELPEFDDYGFKIDNILEAVIKENQIKLSPMDLAKFKNHLRLLARGVRSKIDARMLLLKDFNSAGLGEIAVDKILQHLDELLRNTFSKPSLKLTAPVLSKIAELNKNNLRFEAAYDLRKVLDTKHELNGGLDLSHEISAPLKEIDKVKDLTLQASADRILTEVPVPLIKPEIKVEPTPIKPFVPTPPPFVTPAPSKPALIVNAGLQTLNPNLNVSKPIAPKPIAPKPIKLSSFDSNFGIKHKVEDIKSIKIMDPLDELRLMDIINFRRLGDNPTEATAKIKTRIKLLQTDDYEKGLAAIMAWRQSPINKNYLEIVALALNNNLSLAEAVTQTRTQNSQSLSPEELAAVLALNRELRF